MNGSISRETNDKYRVWAIDNTVYGPITLPTLIEWVRDERVLASTWVHAESSNKWQRAGEYPQLRPHFENLADTAFARRSEQATLLPEEVRQFPVFAGLSSHDIEQFIHFGKVQWIPAGALIIQKGSVCDAVYFIISGEVRARIVVGLDELTLARIQPGEFFGEVGMFIQSTRTADVIAEVDTRLFRLTAEGFQLMIREIPRLAAPVLFALAKTMSHRIADDNVRLRREVASTFLWR